MARIGRKLVGWCEEGEQALSVSHVKERKLVLRQSLRAIIPNRTSGTLVVFGILELLRWKRADVHPRPGTDRVDLGDRRDEHLVVARSKDDAFSAQPEASGQVHHVGQPDRVINQIVALGMLADNVIACWVPLPRRIE